MIESQDRVEQFRAEIAEMKLRDPATGRERVWLGLGIALMVLGAVLAIVAYAKSYNTTNFNEQNDANTLAIGGAISTIIGAAIFLRYSFAAFLRFWLARLIYEQKAQTDRLLEK
jgi:hypothetical protein